MTNITGKLITDNPLTRAYILAVAYTDTIIAYHRTINTPDITVESVNQSQERLESARNALHKAAYEAATK